MEERERVGEKETNRERQCRRERDRECERKYVWVKIALKSIHVVLFSHQHHVKIRTHLKQMFFQKIFCCVSLHISITSHRLCVPLGVMAAWRVTVIMRATVTTSLNSVGLVEVRMRAAVTGPFGGVGLAVLFSQRVAREVHRTYTYVHIIYVERLIVATFMYFEDVATGQ